MIVVIDGNIGSGKSTQVEMLGRDAAFSVHREPLDAWGNLLEWFYDDPARWALAFQFRVIHCFNQIVNDSSDNVISERYPESARRVFWKVLCDKGTVTAEERAVYDDYYRTYTPDVLIYLRVPSDKCHERLSSRGQTGDGAVTLEYIDELHRLYEDMYEEARPNVHVIDGTLPADRIHERIKEIVADYKRNL